MRHHDVFHVSQLDHYTPPTIGQPTWEPHPVIVNDSEELEVDRILDSKRRYGKIHNLVQWAGYSHVRTSWEPAPNGENMRELVEGFHRNHTGKPR
jgi:hypothetical protein